MVEFCGHIIYHYAESNILLCPIQRASHSCVNVGSSVTIQFINMYIIKT